MEVHGAILHIGILLGLSLLGGVIARRFQQPTAIGLLLMGMLFGPNMFNVLKDVSIREFSIEVGATLLLFVIGLEFDLTKLRKVWVKSLLIAMLKFGIVVFLVYEASALFLGLPPKVALAFGTLIAFTSTVVVVKVLEDKGMIDREEIPLLLGILILEDLIAVVLLTVLGTLSGNGLLGVLDSLSSLVLSVVLLLGIFLAALLVLRPSVNFLLKSGNHDDVMNFLALGMCAVFSYIAYALGISSLTGAFLAGSLMATLPNSRHFHEAIRPYAFTFSSLFFISIGTLINPAVIMEHHSLLLALLAIVLLSRFIGIGFVSYLTGTMKGESTFFASIAMASVGEFSLLLAKNMPGTGYDLVTISAMLIMASTLFVSVGVTSHRVLYAGFRGVFPERYELIFEKFATYVRSLCEQLGHETTASRSFHRATKRLFYSFLFSVLIIAVAVRLIVWFNPPILVLFPLLFAIMFVLMKNFIKAAVVAHHTVLNVLTAVDYSRNFSRTQKILKRLVLLSIGTFQLLWFPMTAYALNLNWYFHYIPILLLIHVYFQIRAIAVMSGAFTSKSYMSMPDFKKMEVSGTAY